MTVAQRLQSLSNLVGATVLEHVTSIQQSVNVIGEKYTIVVEEDDIIIKFEEPTIKVNVVEDKTLNNVVIDNGITLKVIDDKKDIKIGEGSWQTIL